MGVNNLPTVVTQECPIWDRTRDLLIARPIPYRCATTPPLETHNAYNKDMDAFLKELNVTVVYKLAKKFCSESHVVNLAWNEVAACNCYVRTGEF